MVNRVHECQEQLAAELDLCVDIQHALARSMSVLRSLREEEACDLQEQGAQSQVVWCHIA